jgi:hypothetical protein
MANTFETFRATVVATIIQACIKQAEGSKSIAYNWSMGRVYDACAKACNIEGKLPTELKNIVQFEFNKLKDRVMNDDGWTALRTSERYVYAGGTVEKRRTDTFGNNALPLTEQLAGARDILKKVDDSLKKEITTERRLALNKRLKRLLGEISFLENEIEAQAKLSASANAQTAAPLVSAAVSN